MIAGRLSPGVNNEWSWSSRTLLRTLAAGGLPVSGPKSEQAFIASEIAEGIEPNSNFPFGPYPADKTVYKNACLVQFETPA